MQRLASLLWRGSRWAIQECGYEGIFAKGPRLTYRSGKHARAWLKIKVRQESVLVVGGIRDVDAFDGVLVGEEVGTRFTIVGSWSGATAPPTVGTTARRASPGAALAVHGSLGTML